MRKTKTKRNSQIIIIDCNKDRLTLLIMVPQRAFDSTTRNFSSFESHFASSDRVAANGQVQVIPLVRSFYNHKQVREKGDVIVCVNFNCARFLHSLFQLICTMLLLSCVPRLPSSPFMITVLLSVSQSLLLDVCLRVLFSVPSLKLSLSVLCTLLSLSLLFFSFYGFRSSSVSLCRSKRL